MILASSSFWNASGASGPLLETFSEPRWVRLWSWKLSGVLFGCIWALFGLLSKLFGIPWDHIFYMFKHKSDLT